MENLKTRAYKNLDDLVPLDEQPVFGPGMVPASLQVVHQGMKLTFFFYMLGFPK